MKKNNNTHLKSKPKCTKIINNKTKTFPLLLHTKIINNSMNSGFGFFIVGLLQTLRKEIEQIWKESSFHKFLCLPQIGEHQLHLIFISIN
jgi:hypothetical protein